MRLSRKEDLILGGITGALFVTGMILTMPFTSAETEGVDVVSVVVPSSCSLGATINTGSEHTVTLRNGQYIPDIGETTIRTNCNDTNGYSIYTIGFSEDTLGNNKLVSQNDYGDDIETGLATGPVGNTDASQWAMKLSVVAGDYAPTLLNDFDDYHVVPDDYVKVATFPNIVDSSVGSAIKTTYAVYASKTQPADTYVGKVKYTIIHPNNGEAPVKPATFTWQDSTTTRPNDEDIEITFQDFDTDTCELGTTGQIGWLKDPRDNQTYQIAKLADGKCWMVENLNLAGGTALSADDTDVTSAYISSFTTSNNLTKSGDTIVLPASSTSGFDPNNYSYVYNSNSVTCGDDSPCFSYYSWDAATLGSGRSISTDNTDAPQSICPKGWKLPTSRGKGASNWQTTSDFYALAHQYGLDSTTDIYESDNGFYTQAGPDTTPNFLLAGGYDNGSFYGGGSYGYYWSSTSSSYTSSALGLGFNSSSVYSASTNDWYFGFSVRCLLSGQ